MAQSIINFTKMPWHPMPGFNKGSAGFTQVLIQKCCLQEMEI